MSTFLKIVFIIQVIFLVLGILQPQEQTIFTTEFIYFALVTLLGIIIAVTAILMKILKKRFDTVTIAILCLNMAGYCSFPPRDYP